MASATRPLVLLAIPLALLAGLSACGEPDPVVPTGSSLEGEAQTARERAAALFAEARYREARAAMEPLVAGPAPDPGDLLRAAILDLEIAESFSQESEGLAERAVERLLEVTEARPAEPAAWYVLAQHFYGYDFERTPPFARRAYELASDDAPTAILHAKVLQDSAYDAEPDAAEAMLAEAEGIFVGLLDQGVEFLGSWYLVTLSNYSTLLLELEEYDRSAEMRTRARELEDRGLTRPTTVQIRQGNYGTLAFPPPSGSAAAPLPALASSAGAGLTLPAGLVDLVPLALEERTHAISIADVDEDIGPDQDYRGRPANTVQVDAFIEPASLVGSDGTALWRADPSAGAWTANILVPARGDLAIETWTALDLGEDRGPRERFEGTSDGRPYIKGLEGERYGIQRSDLEFVVARGGQLELWTRDADGYADAGAALASYSGVLHQIAPLDVDHDGDLDLIAVGSAGALLLRNDGAETWVREDLQGAERRRRADEAARLAAEGDEGEPFEPSAVPEPTRSGAFTVATEQLGLPADRTYTWVVPEDFDSDSDVDLLFGGPDGAFLASSERRERWSDASGRLPTGEDWSRPPLARDFDADGFTDLWSARTGQLWSNRFGESFAPSGRTTDVPPTSSAPAAIDVDLDGTWDVVWTDGAGNLVGVLAPAFDERAALEPIAVGAGPLAIADLDRDCRLDVVAGGADAVVTLEGHTGVRLGFKGVKDNPRGVGAIVHLRAGDLYTRTYLRGAPVLLGIGERTRLDVARTVWPNGVIQSELDLPDCGRRTFEQIEGLVGSCPFLYTWNGTTYEFITDVIGITPLGLPMAPGMLVPPDHDEYVLVRGEQLVPKDGFYELQFTEELREVTYLDRATLIAVDHPEGTEVFPDERFTFPPFPEPHTHTVERLALPVAAIDDRGNDWTAALAAEDMDLAKPFVPHRGQFLGLAQPHTLELRFDPADLEGAEGLRLLMCGWLYWTDASVNVAAARHPDYEFVPPILQVPDGQGGWRDAGPPVGFPAGKTKTMVLDVSGILDPADPRIRVFTTLRLYWDAIRLATCGDDTARLETTLEPVSADLWERGFSCPIYLEGDERLEWFEWENTECAPRWNQHPGQYTRHGDVLPLLDAIDDMYVIMGAGDALTLKFDASELPELPEGWRRDYLVFLDGWAKDRDPNTYEALHVEPLPFHGMSGYPYGADEAYPDTPEHRAYRREWNTREAKRWIDPWGPASQGF